MGNEKLTREQIADIFYCTKQAHKQALKETVQLIIPDESDVSICIDIDMLTNATIALIIEIGKCYTKEKLDNFISRISSNLSMIDKEMLERLEDEQQ